jgi:hypothetical protein
LFERLEISFSYRLDVINYLEHRFLRLLQQGCFELLVRFPFKGFLSVFSFSFTDEYTPFSLIGLQLFHTPPGTSARRATIFPGQPGQGIGAIP